MDSTKTPKEREADPIRNDFENNPFLETARAASVMEDPQTIISDAGLFSETEAETSQNEELEMDSSSIIPNDYEKTPPLAESSLGKRSNHPSSGLEEIKNPRLNKGRVCKQNQQRQAKRPR